MKLLIICPLVFFAGFVDSIAGGGGIISLPAYYVAGVPPHMALGTNKFASSFGTSIATVRFIKNGKIHYKAAVVSVTAALIGSFFGAKLTLVLSADFLRYVLLVLLPVITVFMLKNKSFNQDGFEVQLPLGKILILSGVSGFIIGGYDGFFGPGTGTFLILIFNTVIGFDIITSSGNSKMINLASNIAALVVFLRSGNVMFALALPAAICGILGNYLGSGLVLKRGLKIVKPVFVVVMILLFLKIGTDLLGTLMAMPL